MLIIPLVFYMYLENQKATQTPVTAVPMSSKKVPLNTAGHESANHWVLIHTIAKHMDC